MKKFREVLQKALETGKTHMPNDTIWEYEILEGVYRAVKITGEKQELTIEDFLPQAEIPAIAKRSSFDETDIGMYGTSFFTNAEMLSIILHMPKRNKRIAKGTLKMEFGPILIDNSHIMCFLYEDARIEDEFEVI